MSTPLNIGEKAVGVIGLTNQSNGFNETDVEIEGKFGEIAALALKNVRDWEESTSKR